MKIGVFSDIHGNQYALEKVLQEAASNKVEKLLVLGDIVGYYYGPDKVMDMLSHWDYELIKGNHEKIMQQVAADKGNPEIRKKYGSGHEIAIDKLTPEYYYILTSAPEMKKVNVEGVSILMCHGTNWDADYYLYPDASTEVLIEADEPGVDFVLIGHSHYQFAHRNANSILINAGSVGQSRTKGGIANWAIINTANKCFELKSTGYDTSLLLAEAAAIDPEVNYLQSILKRNTA